MTSVGVHYETHLAPIYVWMAGGIDHALSLGASDLAEHLDRGGCAVDLGAGFGMHTVPLARAGYRVLAVDTSEYLLAELRKHCAGLDVRVVAADLLGFAEHLSERADLILCMGDTLTHLQSMDQVDALMRSAAEALRPGGQFVATFRDYTRLPTGNQRFIPVRSDSDRIHTCFLEERPAHVLVHDLIHERQGESWAMKASSYPKLRLSPERAVQAVEATGMRGCIEPGPRGMLKLRGEA